MSSAPVTDSHCGAVDNIEKAGENSYQIRGRTAPCDLHRSPDCIILSYVGRQTQRMPFTLAFPNVGHPEWNASFLGTLIPGTDPYEIEAWAFDISRVRVYKLAGRHPLP